MSTETNKAIVRRFTEQVWNAGRLDLIDEFFTEDFVEYIVGMPSRSGREAVRESIAISRNAFPDLRISIEDEIADGDKVVTRWTMRGTQLGDLEGIPATGKQVTQSGMSILRLTNARIAELWGYLDNLGLMQQLGVIPVPGAA